MKMKENPIGKKARKGKKKGKNKKRKYLITGFML